uniref:ATP synthase subunit b', chloroplastic n=1 Tax=Cyanidium caldarium TaxID=2771 RepID=ATPF2_CYACA|nr:ATP synthase CF0 B' subunit [Cyanidium caldarium]Q9TM29.1 RecName: Full=ATP synthase subunit b', chloroplastic; AltName: Full=ATP synthase F(0) sector subunit b'; AltName: Full=ATPase subunit II [Cyanidium caldarium]AAF13008.1 unknown [Cyanidium caldarium]WDB00165.1 ATP synthase CF0 B' subunit [Cyanidium caldarium]
MQDILNIYLSSEESGGLFDFDATLPLMASQFLLIMLILDITFYKPINKVLKDRENYILKTLESATQISEKTKETLARYEEVILKSKKESQQLIDSIKTKTEHDIVNELIQTQNSTREFISKSIKELYRKKEQTLKVLEEDTENLSDKIYLKLINPKQ